MHYIYCSISYYASRVRVDIISSLMMHNPYVSIGSFDRTNLFYGVKPFNHGQHFVNELVQDISKNVTRGGSTIIYCTTIKDVEQVLCYKILFVNPKLFLCCCHCHCCTHKPWNEFIVYLFIIL